MVEEGGAKSVYYGLLVLKSRFYRPGLTLIFTPLFRSPASYIFNTLNERSDNLFQGKFKAEHASEDRYLKYLFSYIHLNPAKLRNSRWREQGINSNDRRYVETYEHSSYQDYLHDRRAHRLILSKKEFPEYFKDVKSFKDEMREWLDYPVLE